MFFNIFQWFFNFQKVPVPPVECPVCNIQLSSQQVYVTHVEGKAHKKKLLLLEKEKTRPKEVTQETTHKLPVAVAVKRNDTNSSSNSNIVLANNSAPVISDTIVEIKPSSSTEEVIIAPPPAKKKKKNKVIFSN